MENATIIRLTPDEARELYKSNNETLMGLELKAFSEDALDPLSFDKIKSFEDAVTVLGMSIDDENSIVNTLKERSKAIAAMYKLNIVRKALNSGQDLHFTENQEDSYAYFPRNPFVTESSTFFESQINSGDVDVIGRIKVEGEEYNVLCSYPRHNIDDGFGDFSSDEGIGDASDGLAFLGCANEKIAKHFGKYFGVLILEAKYGDMFDFEVIEDKYGNA